MVKTYSTSSSALPPAEAQYLAAVKKFPILSSEEEVALFKAWYERGDKVALRKLLSAHLRMVVGIAHGFRGYGLLFQELIAEGNLGLMMADSVANDVEIAFGGVSGLGSMTRSGDEIKRH